MNDSFPEAALILIGHGSTVNAESAAPTRQHATELRRRGVFGQVLEGFWKEEPSIRSALERVQARQIFVVPLFISEGYFTLDVIPRELGLALSPDGSLDRRRQDGERTLYYCEPVGTHERMTELVVDRAREVIERFPFPRAPKLSETALFVAGHGTERNQKSRSSIESQAARITAQGLFAEVQAIFMEETPAIQDCYSLTSRKHLIVVPFFISDGLHSYQDIPILLGEPERLVRERMAQGKPTWRNPTERHGKLVWYARSIGSEPGLADVILDRARQTWAQFGNEAGGSSSA